MARGISLLSLLVALVVAGFIMNAQLMHSPSRGSANQEIDRARQAAAAVTFQQATTALEQFHALNGTYAGASLAGFDVALVRADAASYCIESGSGSTLAHLAGPGGAPESGGC